jgi:hypothetical protein
MLKDYSSDLAFTQETDPCFALSNDAVLSHLTTTHLRYPAPATVEEPQLKRKRVKAKAGRPSTREWFERPYVRIDGRKAKVSRCIPADLYKSLSATDYHARLLGRSFTHVLTIKPRCMDAMAPEERLPYWQDLVDNIGRLFRHERQTFTYTVSRESNAILRTGVGEHAHLIGHFPPRLLRKTLKSLKRRFPGAGEVDCLTITQAAKRLRNGKYGSPLQYCLKTMPPRLAWNSNLAWKRGGVILGARAWCSKDLTEKEMNKWRARHRV